MNLPSQESEENTPLQEEQNLPRLYTKRLILIFSLLFSTIFGAALLISNLRHLGKRTAAGWVLLFAIGYLLATAVIMEANKLSPSLSVVANVLGAAILNEYFWNKYIGSDTEFEAKNWFKPAAVSVLIAVIVFSLMMLAG